MPPVERVAEDADPYGSQKIIRYTVGAMVVRVANCLNRPHKRVVEDVDPYGSQKIIRYTVGAIHESPA